MGTSRSHGLSHEPAKQHGPGIGDASHVPDLTKRGLGKREGRGQDAEGMGGGEGSSEPLGNRRNQVSV